jgi:hypothetical protein
MHEGRSKRVRESDSMLHRRKAIECIEWRPDHSRDLRNQPVPNPFAPDRRSAPVFPSLNPALRNAVKPADWAQTTKRQSGIRVSRSCS